MNASDVIREVADYQRFCNENKTCPRPYYLPIDDVIVFLGEYGPWYTQPMIAGLQIYTKPAMRITKA